MRDRIAVTIAGQGFNISRPLDPALFPLGRRDPSGVLPDGTHDRFNPGLGGNGTGSAANLDGIPDLVFLVNRGPNTSTQNSERPRSVPLKTVAQTLRNTIEAAGNQILGTEVVVHTPVVLSLGRCVGTAIDKEN